MADTVKTDDIEENFAKTVFIVEKELGVLVDENYLLLKFYNQIEYLKEMREEEQKEYDRIKHGRGTLG